MKVQNVPVKEFRIWCMTDSDLNQDELGTNLEAAKAVLNDYRADYPNDSFKLVAIVDV